jgi:hypothetical protein
MQYASQETYYLACKYSGQELNTTMKKFADTLRLYLKNSYSNLVLNLSKPKHGNSTQQSDKSCLQCQCEIYLASKYPGQNFPLQCDSLQIQVKKVMGNLS